MPAAPDGRHSWRASDAADAGEQDPSKGRAGQASEPAIEPSAPGLTGETFEGRIGVQVVDRVKLEPGRREMLAEAAPTEVVGGLAWIAEPAIPPPRGAGRTEPVVQAG